MRKHIFLKRKLFAILLVVQLFLAQGLIAQNTQIPNPVGYSNLTPLTAYNGLVYAYASKSSGYIDLFTIDPNTTAVQNITLGLFTTVVIPKLTAYNGAIYFLSKGGLYKINPSNQLVTLEYGYTGWQTTDYFYPALNKIVIVNSTNNFIVYDPSTSNSYSLKYNGVTLSNAGTNPQMVECNNELYFWTRTSSTANNLNLYKYNGSSSSVIQVSNAGNILAFTSLLNQYTPPVINNCILFELCSSPSGSMSILSYNLNSGSTSNMNISYSINSNQSPINYTFYNNKVYYNVNGYSTDGLSPFTYGLSPQISPLISTITLNNNVNSSINNVNNTLIGSNYDAVYGQELWKSDGTSTGTVLLADINKGTYTNSGNTYSNSSNPRSGFVDGNTLYFMARVNDNASSNYINYIWQTDGTTNGTVEISQLDISVLYGTGNAGISNYLFARGTDGILYRIVPVVPTPCIPTTSTEIVTACNSYTWHGTTYTSNNTTATFVTTNAAGCDSTVTLNLTIACPPTIKSISPTIATTGDIITITGLNFTGTTDVSFGDPVPATSFSVLNDSTIKAVVPSGAPSVLSGNVIVTTPGGIDSMAGFVYCSSPIKKFYTYSGCNSIVYKNKTYTQSASLQDTIKSYQGCDSIYNIISINITPIVAVTKPITLSGCNSVTYNGKAYSQTTIVIDTLKSSQGCDSIYNVATIIITPIVTTNDSIVLSGCDSINYNNKIYYFSTSWVDTIRNLQGCDSLYNHIRIIITPTPPKPIISSNSPIYIGDTIKLSTVSVNGISYLWNGPNGFSASTQNPMITNATLLMAGNYQLRDSINGCVSPASSIYIIVNNFLVSGNIKTPLGKFVNPKRPITVSVTGNDSLSIYPDSIGNYGFNVIKGGSYTLRPSKNNDSIITNGVSTIDITLIQSHILKKSFLNSPFKLIVADVNNDKKITSIDITFIKRLILKKDTTFVGNRLWAFVDSAYKFTDSTNPFPYKDSISISNLTESKINQSFVAMKLGDVNWDWLPSTFGQQATTNQPLELYYDTVYTNNTSEVKLHLKANHFKELIGMQFGLGFDKALYEFVGIENNTLGIEYGATYSKEGQLSFLWNDPKNVAKTLADGSELFTIVLHKKGNTASSSDLALNGDITAVEAYDKDLQFHNIVKRSGAILEKANPITNIEKETVTVSPNPSNGNIIVTIQSKAEKKVLLNLSDANGKQVLSKVVNLTKGKNSVPLSLQLSTGTYYLAVDGLDEKAVKQVLIIQ